MKIKLVNSCIIQLLASCAEYQKLSIRGEAKPVQATRSSISCNCECAAVSWRGLGVMKEDQNTN